MKKIRWALIAISLTFLSILFQNCDQSDQRIDVTESELASFNKEFSEVNYGAVEEAATDAISKASANTNPSKRKPTLKTIGRFGLTYTYLGGPKGVVMCFHGSGGSAKGWTQGDKKKYLDALARSGYSYICPTSVDRKRKKWDPSTKRNNKDILNAEALLKVLRIKRSLPLFLVGHSNGGGFIGRLYMLSPEFGKRALALHYANSSGIDQLLSHKNYEDISLFSYAHCDPVVDYKKVLNSIKILNRKKVWVTPIKLDFFYVIHKTKYKNCHDFMDTSVWAIRTFDVSMVLAGISPFKNTRRGSINVKDRGR